MRSQPRGPARDDQGGLRQLARAEARTLTDQLRQAQRELHRMGIADPNRAAQSSHSIMPSVRHRPRCLEPCRRPGPGHLSARACYRRRECCRRATDRTTR